MRRKGRAWAVLMVRREDVGQQLHVMRQSIDAAALLHSSELLARMRARSPSRAAGRLERAGRRCAASDGRHRAAQTLHTLRRGCRARLGQRVPRVAEAGAQHGGRSCALQQCRGDDGSHAVGWRLSLSRKGGRDVMHELGRCARAPQELQSAALRLPPDAHQQQWRAEHVVLLERALKALPFASMRPTPAQSAGSGGIC